MVEPIEKRRQRSEVTTNATEKVVEYGIVQLQPTPRGALTQDVSAAGFIERLHNESRALFQPRNKVRHHERQCGRHRHGRIDQPRSALSRAVVEMEQGHFILTVASDGLQSIQANQPGAALSDQGIAHSPSHRCQR